MKIITTHDNPTFDSLAGVFAASLLCKDAVVVIPKNIDRAVKNFLSTHFSDSDYRFAGAADAFSGATELILICAKNLKRVPHAAKLSERANIYISIYDKSPAIAPDIAADSIIEAEYGAVTTLLCEKLFEQKINISKIHATLFALGIHEVTGSLLYPNTRVNDITCLSKLLKAGADLNTVSMFLKDKLSDIQSEILNKLVASRQVINVNGVDVTIYSAESARFIYKFDNIIQKIVDNDNFSLVFFIARMGNNIHISARNNMEEINIGGIFKTLGGGGPKYAASATLKGCRIPEAIATVKALLKKKIAPKLTAADIMSHPVLLLSSDISVREAERILFRYGVSGAPVHENNSIKGFLKRADIDKAIHHGIGNNPIKAFLCKEIIYVSPGESFENIKHKISDSETKIILVGSESKTVGIITRSDVLNYAFNEKSHYKKKKTANFLVHDHAADLESIKRGPEIKIPLEKIFSRKVMKFLKRVSKKAAELNASAYLVGGIVRDIILEKESLDIDIVIEGMSGIEFVRKFVENKEFILNMHEKFKTATVKMPDLPKVDFATARSEFYESPAALPDVFQSNLYQDLLRRDFTVNALAISLNKDNFGFLIDYYGGFADIKKKSVRILHSLSFVEDPTRIFRAIRFKSRLGFRIERYSEEKIKEALGYGVVNKVEPIRIFNEMELIFNEPDPYKIICEMKKYKLFEFIHADIVFTEKIQKVFKNACSFMKKFHLNFPAAEKPDLSAVYFSVILLGITVEKIPELLAKMHAGRQTRDKIIEITEDILETCNEFEKSGGAGKKISDLDIYRLLRGRSNEFISVFSALSGSVKAAGAAYRYISKISCIKTTLNGEILKKMGITPGPLFKEIFEKAVEEKIRGNLRTHIDELGFAKKFGGRIAEIRSKKAD